MLKERGYSYVVNITRGTRAKDAEVFENEHFEELPGRKNEQKVELVKIADAQDPDSHLVLCRSAQRRLKEEAMISTAEKRFLAGVKNLRKRIAIGRFKKPGVIAEKIVALMKKHPRLARLPIDGRIQKGDSIGRPGIPSGKCGTDEAFANGVRDYDPARRWLRW
jgi:hypothetical protein